MKAFTLFVALFVGLFGGRVLVRGEDPKPKPALKLVTGKHDAGAWFVFGDGGDAAVDFAKRAEKEKLERVGGLFSIVNSKTDDQYGAVYITTRHAATDKTQVVGAFDRKDQKGVQYSAGFMIESGKGKALIPKDLEAAYAKATAAEKREMEADQAALWLAAKCNEIAAKK